jgi:N-acyl-L-homoserine lactone synthetase
LVTRFRDLEIYQIHASEAPATMREIGRIREVEFSRDGGGTGKELDIDQYDQLDYCFQLLVWDPRHGEIVAFYRYLPLWLVPQNGLANATPGSRLFEFSDGFHDDIAPHFIELGRSVVNRDARRKILGLFAFWSRYFPGGVRLIRNRVRGSVPRPMTKSAMPTIITLWEQTAGSSTY